MSILKANRIENLTTTDGGINVNNSGNVGINTSSPDRKLHVAGSFIRVDDGYGLDSSGSTEKVVLDNGFISQTTNSSERLRIDSSGRVLVGTTSAVDSGATSSLQVVNTSTSILALARNDSSISAGNDLGAIRFYGNAGGSYQQCAQIIAEADGTHANNDKPSRLVFATTADGASSPTERMRITSSGTIQLTAATNSSNQAIQFGDPDADNRGLIQYRHGTDALHIYTAASERMRIDSSGHVSIGTTTANRTFQVGKSGAETFELEPGESANNNLSLHYNRNSNQFITNEQRALDHRFMHQSTEKVRINSNGLTFNGDTAAANALDDYEEGTFTPTLEGSSGSPTHTNQSGTYTKIGRLVHCRIHLGISSKGSLSGGLKVGSLPFTVANVDSGTSLDFGGVVTYFLGLSDTVYFIGVHPVGGTTTATMYARGSSNQSGTLDASDISNSFETRAFFTYYV